MFTIDIDWDANLHQLNQGGQWGVNGKWLTGFLESPFLMNCN